MRRAEDLLANATAVVVCTPDSTGRLIGKKRSIADWPGLLANGLAMPDFHLITGIENRPLHGFSVAGAGRGFGNGRLRPDPAAAFVSPLDPDAPYLLADSCNSDGALMEEAPRQMLRRQVARLAAHGVSARFASELEFYVFRHSFADAHALGYSGLQPIYHRHGDNDVLIASLAGRLCTDITDALAACGVRVDQVQGEGGAGQLEVNIAPGEPLVAADQHAVFKHVVKAVAHRSGCAATFLAKPSQDDAGSGGHVHISFTSADGVSVLGRGTTLAPFGAGFLAGLLVFTPELTLLHAPYANSYRRLTPSAFTPLRATWGWDNRIAMVRVIDGPAGLRFEVRLPGADANPYFVYSAILAAGLAGVDAGYTPPQPMCGDAVPDGAVAVPADLTEALDRFQRSPMASGGLGPAIHRHLSALGAAELATTRRSVTTWEVARGFEGA